MRDEESNSRNTRTRRVLIKLEMMHRRGAVLEHMDTTRCAFYPFPQRACVFQRKRESNAVHWTAGAIITATVDTAGSAHARPLKASAGRVLQTRVHEPRVVWGIFGKTIF